LSELKSQRYNKQGLLRTTCPNLLGGVGEVKLRMDSRGKVEKRAGKGHRVQIKKSNEIN